MSNALWLPDGAFEETTWLTEARLGEGGHYDEAWLQTLLFERPAVIPIDEIDPGATGVVPVCRELPLAHGDHNVYLDILGVTPVGRLVLIECKLWRNPQARREVIGQILEYAALLQRWTYSDLTARLKASLGWSGANPLFHYVSKGNSDLSESAFVDAVSRSLVRGDFNLIVAGDGIRSGIQTIKSYLDLQRGLTSRLALVEFQVWTSSSGATLVTPLIPLRTTVIEHRVIIGVDDVPLMVEEAEASSEEMEKVVDPDAAARRKANRAFWQGFIDTIEFDHPDQTPPRHGGENWVKLDLPGPARPLTIYRTKVDWVGLAVRFTGEGGDEALEWLEEEADAIREETKLPLEFHERGEHPPGVTVQHFIAGSTEEGQREQLEWLLTAVNSFVNALRPRLAAWARERGELS